MVRVFIFIYLTNEINKKILLFYMPLPIITEINDRNHFAEILKTNPGLFFIKFDTDNNFLKESFLNKFINFG